MLHFNFANQTSRQGFTLLEAIISLAIISTIAAISFIAVRETPPKIKRDRAVADFLEEITMARHDAVQASKIKTLIIRDCQNEKVMIHFYPNGTTSGNKFCLYTEIFDRIVKISPLTGRIVIE